MKKIIFSIVMLFTISLPHHVFAYDLGDAFGNMLKNAGNEAGYDTASDETKLQSIISSIITTALSFLGIIFLILLIYGGYIYMMARGNEDEVKKALGIIKTAIIGLIIVMMAYAISYFVIQSLQTVTLG